jgi:hypothetical protein
MLATVGQLQTREGEIGYYVGQSNNPLMYLNHNGEWQQTTITPNRSTACQCITTSLFDSACYSCYWRTREEATAAAEKVAESVTQDCTEASSWW